MSVELPPEASRFGDSRLHAYVTFPAGKINWRHFGVLIGWSNGCPKPKFNMDEVGEERYCREHAPLNFWWSTLVNEVAEPLRGENPALIEDMVNGFEEAPPVEKYDEDCVPKSYLAGKQYGLARESAYFLTSKIVETIQVAQQTGSDVQSALFGQLERLEELIQDTSITTMAQLWERFSHQNSGHCSLYYSATSKTI